MSKKQRIFLGIACFLFLRIVLYGQARAQAQTSLPKSIQLEIFALFPGGASTGNVCTKGVMEYGCTAYSDKKGIPGYLPADYGYPFNVSEVTLDFETQYLLKSLRESRKFIQLVTYPYV